MTDLSIFTIPIELKYGLKIPSYVWGRIGQINKRFGTETVLKAIEYNNTKPKNINHLLNILELCCQKIVENEDTVDIFKL